MSIETEILSWAKKQCKLNGVKFICKKGKYILTEGYPVSGFFAYDEAVPALHFSTGVPDWVGVLSHEISHMFQWVEQTEKWKIYHKCRFNMTNWLDGSYCHPDQVRNGIKKTVAMELECEKKSLALLQAFGYGEKESEEYTQKANAYLVFYSFVRDNRKWSAKGKSPYRDAKIWKKFPSTFAIDLEATYQRLKHLYVGCV